MFSTPYDIANVACQLLGCARISSFTDNSVQAPELGFAYDKLRRRELKRNVWVFAIRRAVIRAISTTTMTLSVSAWAIGTTYPMGQLVAFTDTNGTRVWQSLAAGNVGNTPGDTSTVWSLYFGPASYENYPNSVNTAFDAGDVIYVTGSPDTAYLSLVGNNSDQPPSSNWLALNGTLVPYAPLYPAGAGPSSDPGTANVFLLPIGYLNMAPQDPKAGFLGYLGAPSERSLKDWVLENGMLISQDPNDIHLRFVADVVNVPMMDDMFCEGLGAEMGWTCCEIITQSTAKKQACRDQYSVMMSEARVVNGIEEGPTEPPLDDWINCRI